MHNTRLLLELLTKEIPPKENQHHNITLDGDLLQVSLMLPQGVMRFHIQEDEMDTPICDLMEELRQLYVHCKRLPKSSWAPEP